MTPESLEQARNELANMPKFNWGDEEPPLDPESEESLPLDTTGVR